MSQTWVGEASAMEMNGLPPEDEDLASELRWNRFYMGIAIVLVFSAVTTAIVTATHGTRFGACYGLSILVAALAAGMVDGVVILRRRSRR